ncbi:lanthionine synthetase, partial [Streptococcus pneumoniae]
MTILLKLSSTIVYGEIYHYFLHRDTAKESILDYSFPHGYCGLAYALFAYSKVLVLSIFYTDLHTFHP